MRAWSRRPKAAQWHPGWRPRPRWVAPRVLPQHVRDREAAPLLGVGTGGFFKAYEEQVQGTRHAAHAQSAQYVSARAGAVRILDCLLGISVVHAVALRTSWSCARDAVLAYAVVVTIAPRDGLFNSHASSTTPRACSSRGCPACCYGGRSAHEAPPRSRDHQERGSGDRALPRIGRVGRRDRRRSIRAAPIAQSKSSRASVRRCTSQPDWPGPGPQRNRGDRCCPVATGS